MPVRLHSRKRGATINCSNCPATYTTGQITVRGIRAGAKQAGWIRGLWSPSTAERKANKKADICPACAPAERAAADARKAAADLRRKERDEGRKQRDAKMSAA